MAMWREQLSEGHYLHGWRWRGGHLWFEKQGEGHLVGMLDGGTERAIVEKIRTSIYQRYIWYE